MTITEKIKQLTTKEIVMSMVNGLRNPQTKINMNTFGFVNYSGVCYGCAATNALMYLDTEKELVLPLPGIPEGFTSCFTDDEEKRIIDIYEAAIDYLRCGHIDDANFVLERLELGPINYDSSVEYPYLMENYTSEELDIYEQLANEQDDSTRNSSY